MARLKLSEDVLKLNPDLARSRAVTDSGIGHGHTDDATVEKYVSPNARHVLARHMKSTLAMMEVWGAAWAGTTEAKKVATAIENYLKRMEQSS